MLAIVPLWVWGATGSWRRALQAGGTYLLILFMLLAVGAGLGLLMVVLGM